MLDTGHLSSPHHLHQQQQQQQQQQQHPIHRPIPGRPAAPPPLPGPKPSLAFARPAAVVPDVSEEEEQMQRVNRQLVNRTKLRLPKNCFLNYFHFFIFSGLSKQPSPPTVSLGKPQWLPAATSAITVPLQPQVLQSGLERLGPGTTLPLPSPPPAAHRKPLGPGQEHQAAA